MPVHVLVTVFLKWSRYHFAQEDVIKSAVYIGPGHFIYMDNNNDHQLADYKIATLTCHRHAQTWIAVNYGVLIADC